MVIEREKIEEAKEKLGDRNAEIIAEILQLEKWDEKSKKALCPFHEEDTPSFVYNPKSHSFHCFGCQKNFDIMILIKSSPTNPIISKITVLPYVQSCISVI